MKGGVWPLTLFHPIKSCIRDRRVSPSHSLSRIADAAILVKLIHGNRSKWPAPTHTNREQGKIRSSEPVCVRSSTCSRSNSLLPSPPAFRLVIFVSCLVATCVSQLGTIRRNAYLIPHAEVCFVFYLLFFSSCFLTRKLGSHKSMSSLCSNLASQIEQIGSLFTLGNCQCRW